MSICLIHIEIFNKLFAKHRVPERIVMTKKNLKWNSRDLFCAKFVTSRSIIATTPPPPPLHGQLWIWHSIRTFNRTKLRECDSRGQFKKSGNEFKSGSDMHPDKKKFKLIRKLETFCGLLNGRFFSNTVFYLRLLYINRTCFIVFISCSLINTPFCSRHWLVIYPLTSNLHFPLKILCKQEKLSNIF